MQHNMIIMIMIIIAANPPTIPPTIPPTCTLLQLVPLLPNAKKTKVGIVILIIYYCINMFVATYVLLFLNT